MATPNDVLRIAAGEIGYYAPNDPEPGSKYGRWEAQKLNQAWLAGPSTSIWWCMIFVSWVLDQAGQPLPGTPGFNCDTVLGAARGQVLPNKRDAKPGDVVIFDWTGNGSGDHTGFVELNKGGYLQTIEGNTSSGTAGSQSAGNGVWRRTRSWSVVKAVIRPAYSGAPAPAPAPASSRKIDEDGSWGKDTTTLAQTVLGTPVDGIVSGQPPVNRAVIVTAAWAGSGWEWVTRIDGSAMIRRMEQIMKADGQYKGKIDGWAGKQFAQALCLRYNGAVGNGKLDRISQAVKGMQRALNAGRF